MDRRQFFDKLFRLGVKFAGNFTVLCVLALFIYMGLQVWPLFQEPRWDTPELHSWPEKNPTKPLAFIFHEKEHLLTLLDSTSISIIQIQEKNTVTLFNFILPLALNEKIIQTHVDKWYGLFAILTSQHRLALFKSQIVHTHTADNTPSEDELSVTIKQGAWIDLPQEINGQALLQVSAPEGKSTLVLTGDKHHPWILQLDSAWLNVNRYDTLPIASLEQGAFSSDGSIFLAYSQNWLYQYDLSMLANNLSIPSPLDLVPPKMPLLLADRWKLSTKLTAIQFGFGNDNFAALQSPQGKIQIINWTLKRQENSAWRFEPRDTWEAPLENLQHSKAQLDADPKARNFYAWSTQRFKIFSVGSGAIKQDRLMTIPEEAQIGEAGESLCAIQSTGIWIKKLQDPHPAFSFRSLWAKICYPGYAQAEWVWQNSSGNEATQPKWSIVPLLFGTLKASFYALLFALPLAFGAALYVSHFASPQLKNWIKPFFELAGSVPGVILGFMAGTILAPWLMQHILWLALFFTVTPVLLYLTAHFLFRWQTRFRLIPMGLVFMAGVLLYFPIEQFLQFVFLGPMTLQDWLESHGWRYSMHSSLLLGLAMGFAAFPTIFTLAEDALSHIPMDLIAAARALGANPWQALSRVAMRCAAPGLLLAAILGLSQTIGETMIVLMVSGNTPLLDTSPFVGLRTLSATLAIELPEATSGHTLFRVLFLLGFLLFVGTFVLHALADYFHNRFRRQANGDWA